MRLFKRAGRSNQQISDRKKLLLMQICFCLVYVFSFLAASLIVFAFDLREPIQYEICIGMLLLASFICGFRAAKHKNEKGFLAGFLCCLPQNLLVLLASFCLNRFSADWTLLFGFVILVIASMLGGILAVNQRQKPKIKTGRGGRR